LKSAAGGGAPSFKITHLDFNAFQMHYAEWADTDITAFLATGAYVGTVEADTFPSPFAVAYPAAGATPALINQWDVTSAASAHLNWYPMNSTPGSFGKVMISWPIAGPYQYTNPEGFSSSNLIVD
jgi:hypothetical protein